MVKGKMIQYEVIGDGIKKTRKARVTKVEFNQKVGKFMYTAITPFGHEVKLTKDECILLR